MKETELTVPEQGRKLQVEVKVIHKEDVKNEVVFIEIIAPVVDEMLKSLPLYVVFPTEF